MDCHLFLVANQASGSVLQIQLEERVFFSTQCDCTKRSTPGSQKFRREGFCPLTR